MPEKIVIPFVSADYTAQFRRPAVKLLALDRIAVIQAIVDAWEPWGFQLNNMEVRSQGNFTEQGAHFTLPDKAASLFVGPTECRFHKERAYWGDIEETLQILDAARSAVLEATKVEIAKQTVVIGLHLQLTTRGNKAVLRSLLSPTLGQLNDDNEPTAYAAIVGWENKHLLLDTSAAYANGLFMRLSIVSDGNLSLDELVNNLHKEEMRIFRMLDVEDSDVG